MRPTMLHAYHVLYAAIVLAMSLPIGGRAQTPAPYSPELIRQAEQLAQSPEYISKVARHIGLTPSRFINLSDAQQWKAILDYTRDVHLKQPRLEDNYHHEVLREAVRRSTDPSYIERVAERFGMTPIRYFDHAEHDQRRMLYDYTRDLLYNNPPRLEDTYGKRPEIEANYSQDVLQETERRWSDPQYISRVARSNGRPRHMFFYASKDEQLRMLYEYTKNTMPTKPQ